ncbi:hypothetical protein WDZ92_33615, partial [Nostoc sp. NIES-2111]
RTCDCTPEEPGSLAAALTGSCRCRLWWVASRKPSGLTYVGRNGIEELAVHSAMRSTEMPIF